MMQMAWRGGERRFLRGVKRAALVCVAAPVLIVLVPLHLWLLPGQTAMTHLAVGALFSVVMIEALFAGFGSVPFAASYTPAGNVKTVGPLALVAFVIFLNAFVRIESAALDTTNGITLLLASLAATIVLIRVLDMWLHRGRQPLTFDDPPEAATQWLGLSG
jgi:hypothetical protein